MERNKFEHLMTDKNRAELKAEGKTTVMQYDKNWNKEKPVATVSHYVTIRLPYAAAKNILGEAVYCHKRCISKGNYDAKTKTIELTGLYPISHNKSAERAGLEIVDEYYTYGV